MFNENENFAKIKVIGLGGAGSNAIDNMIAADIHGVEFIACNTDLPHLSSSSAPVKLEIGPETTGGLGSGMDPEIGKAAAEESIDEIKDMLSGADLVILALGEGGGTGTGAAPVFARVAKKEKGILTIAVVTTPLNEGKKRNDIARDGIEKLRDEVDAIVVVNSERVFNAAIADDEGVSVKAAYQLCDDALLKNVQAITEVVSRYGAVNVDMTDVITTIRDKGTLRVGIGEASGSDAAIKAVQQAISSPLLESPIDDATNAIVAVFGSEETLTAKAYMQATKMIEEVVHEDALIEAGLYYDDQYEDRVKVIVIAAGFDEKSELSGPNQAPREMPEEVKLEIPDNIADLEKSEPPVAQTPLKTSSSSLDSIPLTPFETGQTSISSTHRLFSSDANSQVSSGSISSLAGLGSFSTGQTSAISNPSLQVPELNEETDDDLAGIAFIK